MIAFLDGLFNIEGYANRADKDQARLIYSVTVVMLVLFILYALFVVQGAAAVTLAQQAASDSRSLAPILSVLAVGVLTLALTRLGRPDISAFGPVILWYLSGVLLGYNGHFVSGDQGAALLVFIFLCGLFLRGHGLIGGTVVAMVTLAIAAANFQPGAINGADYRNDVIGLGLQMIGGAVVTYLFLRITRLDQITRTTQDYEERLKLANVTTQIARRISRRAALSDLLSNTIDEILQNYGDVYHAQIFLVEEQTREAALAASTGEVGQVLLKRRHSLPVGSRSVIGQVTEKGEAIIARADSPDGVHRRNEFLPDTLVEAAFPLKIGEKVIGALDLQSRFEDAFDKTDVPIFQSLTDSIAIAIDNARLFEQTEDRLRENQRLLEQMRGAMREVERLNRELTQQAWSQYLANKGNRLSLDVDFSSDIRRSSDEWTTTLTEAARFNHIVQTQTSEGVIVSVPLRVRGQVVGAMEFELEGEALTPEDVDLVQSVAERFGLAIESTRLYEESRRVAQRETMLNEIGSRLQRSNSVDTVLVEAARGLQSTLGANRVAIRLGAPPKVATDNGGAV